MHRFCSTFSKGRSPRRLVWLCVAVYILQLVCVYRSLHPSLPLYTIAKVTRYRDIPVSRLEGAQLARDNGGEEAWKRELVRRGRLTGIRGTGETTRPPRPSKPYNSLGPTHIQQEVAGWGREWQPEGPAATFLRYVTQPGAACRHLVRLGGRSCVRRLDGDKLVCLDHALGISPGLNRGDGDSGVGGCLVVGVGVGHDLSFDHSITHFACHAHAFDDDHSYRFWARDQGPFLTFHRGRLGTLTGNFTFCNQEVGLSSCTSYIHYTLQDLLARAESSVDRGEGKKGVQYLKMDIEGAEWEVVAQALRRGWLRNVTQLAVEIHLEDLRDPILTDSQRRDAVSFYLHVFAGLEAEGLSLAAFIPNSLNPETTKLDGVLLPCYAEMLWLRR